MLALDSGTTSVRTVAFDAHGHPVDSDARTLTQHFPAPGEVEHDPSEIAQLAVATLREVARRCRERGDEVVALGITNQRETTVAFDRATGRSRHRALVWQDRRTALRCEQLTLDGHLDVVRARTGLVLDPYFSATKMHWLVSHGALDDASVPSLSTVDAYLVWTLTGGVDGGLFRTEPSNASRTMLFDIATRQWSTQLGQILEVDTSLLPEVVASASEFGTVAAAVVPELAGVAITGVLGDQQAALFGQACFRPGMVKATYGTGAFILAHAGDSVPEVPQGLVATVAWDLGARGGVAYALEGSAFVAGAAIQWLRDELGLLAHASDLEDSH